VIRAWIVVRGPKRHPGDFWPAVVMVLTRDRPDHGTWDYQEYHRLVLPGERSWALVYEDRVTDHQALRTLRVWDRSERALVVGPEPVASPAVHEEAPTRA
jgi:hypothetical protein